MASYTRKTLDRIAYEVRRDRRPEPVHCPMLGCGRAMKRLPWQVDVYKDGVALLLAWECSEGHVEFVAHDLSTTEE